MKAGTDLDCGVEYRQSRARRPQAADRRSEIDRAGARLLEARFKLGMFDPPSLVKYAHIPYSVNDSPAHRELARKQRANRSCC